MHPGCLSKTFVFSFVTQTSFYSWKDMIDRGKTKQASSRRLNRGLKEYRISQLPDPLICHVLSLLSTKEAVGTSILSTRWRNLWLWVHRFELSHWEFLDFNAFVSFGNRYFDSTRLSCIHNLKLTIDENEASYLTPWIDALVKSKIQHLCVRRTGGGSSFHEMPLSLYVCETLVSLKLVQLTLVDTEFVSLPCLKTMHLYNNIYPKETTFERLVSSCPVLEDLMIDVLRNDAKVYRVHSRSLKRLRFLRSSSLQSDSVPGVVIDAPLLCSLRISDGVSKMFIVKDMKCNAKLDISFDFGLEAFDESNVSSISHIRNFLSGISRVRDMTISAFTFEVYNIWCMLIFYDEKFLTQQYTQLSLVVSDHSSLFQTRTPASVWLHDPPGCYSLCIYLQWLPTFLERCPNLTSLELVMIIDFFHTFEDSMHLLIVF